MASRLTSRTKPPTTPRTSPSPSLRAPGLTRSTTSRPSPLPRASDAICDSADDAPAGPSGPVGRPGNEQRPSIEPALRPDRRQTHLVIFGLSGQESRGVCHHVANRLQRPFVDTSSLADLRLGQLGTASDGADAGTIRRVLGRRNAVVLAAGRTPLDTAAVPELADAVVIHIGRPDERLGRHIADAHIEATESPEDLVDRVVDAWEAAVATG